MKYDIRKISVATNFTEEADNAIDYAIFLAKKYNAGLDIIHAVLPARIGKGELVAAAYGNLRKIRDSINKKHGIKAKVFSRMGNVTDFIYKYCVENKTDLLIIGVQNHVKKYFGDSTSYEIIMKIECPVLSVPLSFKKQEFGHILYPVRNVKGVEEKLSYSKPFLDKHYSKLHLVCFGQQISAKLDEVVEMALKDGISVDISNYPASSTKDITSQIITLANEFKHDLIVINATAEKDWYRLFGENYTEYILKKADIAVLSITHSFESEIE